MGRAFYCKSVGEFLHDSESVIRDALTQRHSKSFYQQLRTQTRSWENFISLLKEKLSEISKAAQWGILLEYPIPRRAKRIDAVLISQTIIFVIEYKDKSDSYDNSHIVQLEDYCLDLQDFHEETHKKLIVPILLCPDAPTVQNPLEFQDGIQDTILANTNNFSAILSQCANSWENKGSAINYMQWNESRYNPTPTIIEAARFLYAGHDVKEISRSHAGAKNLSATTDALIEAIKEAQKANSKIICFVTGVPGAGKTLVGLNIVHNRDFQANGKELGIFLSGNSPLVKVLTEALSRDLKNRKQTHIKEANRKVSTFIQNVHQFIDEYYHKKRSKPPDRVLIYDEAQRAWTQEYKNRKSEGEINASEPDILLSIMDRFKNSWAVIIALIGNGQEINTGEGGLSIWGKALVEKFKHWKVYASLELMAGNVGLFPRKPKGLVLIPEDSLHLKVSMRSFKAEKLHMWVEAVLQNRPDAAAEIMLGFSKSFPIFLTRSLHMAKNFLRAKLKGSKRAGLVISSNAKRLRAVGVDVEGGLKGTSSQDELGAWYLNSANDVRSSTFLEVPGSEFGVQGLELDWTLVGWDLDLRRENNGWAYKKFSGTTWKNVTKLELQQYILNRYRVLLTRAREGMVIWVPEGSQVDITRPVKDYTLSFEYLKLCGAIAL